MSLDWGESASFNSFPPEESKDFGYHLTESIVDSTNTKPAVKNIVDIVNNLDIVSNLPKLWVGWQNIWHPPLIREYGGLGCRLWN